MWVAYLCCKEPGRKLKVLSKAGAWSEDRTTAHRSVRDCTRLPQRTCLDRQGCDRRFWKIDAKVFPLPVNLGHSCITGSDHQPRQGAGGLEPQPCRLPSASGSQTPRKLLTLEVLLPLGRATIQKPIPQRGPRLHVRNSEVMSKSHLGNGSAPPNVKASTQARTTSGGTLTVHTCASAGAGPCATWASPTEGVRGPTSCPGGPSQGSQGAREMDYWIRKWTNV